MRIIKLKAENFKRLKAVDIEPDNNIVKITGKNAQGKSSVLDSIIAAFAYPGIKDLPKPVREGEDKAVINIETEDFNITRKFTKGGTAIEITNKQDMAFKSPQAMLDQLMGKFTFDPLQFKSLGEKAQVDTLLKCTKSDIDFDEMKNKRQKYYDERTMVNRRLKDYQKYLNGDEPEKVELISVLKLNQKHASLISRSKEYFDKKKFIEQLQIDLSLMQEELNEANQAFSKMTDVSSKLEEVEIELANVDEINAQARIYDSYMTQKNMAIDLKAQAEKYSNQITAIDNKKQTAIKKVKFPIDELSFDEDGVIYQNVPFKQASDAEQTRVSTAIAMASNPNLRVILIRNGSLLDDNNMAIIKQMAEENDFQIWIETVSDGESGIVIEDGTVK